MLDCNLELREFELQSRNYVPFQTNILGGRHELPYLCSYELNNITIVTWSTTEKREIRNFPYPSVFELASCQRLTVKRGIRNVGQLRPAVEGRKECGSSYLYPVTSPG